MRGKYKIYVDNECVAEQSNVITTYGKTLLLRYIAGLVPSFARSIAIGTGDTAAAESQKYLDFEYARNKVMLGTIDQVADPAQVVFKTEFGTGSTVQINELGVFSYSAGDLYSGDIVSEFISTDDWQTNDSVDDISYVTTTVNSDVRVGYESLRVLKNGVNSEYVEFYNLGTFIDASGYSASDRIGLAIVREDNNVASVTIALIDSSGSSASHLFTLGTYSAGAPYETLSATLDDFSSGSFNWSAITQVKVGITYKSGGGNAAIAFDGLKIFDVDMADLDYCMISRTKLGSPVLKTADQTLDIEYSVEFDL